MSNYKNLSCLWIVVVLCLLLSYPLHAKELIDLFCPDVERKEAILTCAFQAGVKVVFLEDVKGRVNLRKDHLRFEEALSLILKGSGLSWFRADGVYYIGVPSSQDMLTHCNQPFEHYELKHRKSQEVIASLPQYQDNLLPDGNFSLLIAGDEKLRRAIRERIRALDVPKTHILVKALIVECEEREAKKLGLFLPTENEEIAVGEVSLGGPFERLEALKPYLEALEEKGKVRLQPEMKVLVLEGEKGEVSVTGETYCSVSEVTEPRKVDVGTTLEVIPWKLDEDLIKMDLKLTVKDFNGADRSLPSVVRRGVQTSLILKEGTIVSIAGLKQEEEQKSRKVTHRKKSSQKDKRELIVLLQVEEKEFTPVESVVSFESAESKIMISESSYSYEYQLILRYASPVSTDSPSFWGGIAFTEKDEISLWQIEGEILLNPVGWTKEKVTLRYPLEANTELALQWSGLQGNSSHTVYSLYLEENGALSSQIDWHAGIGTHLSGSQELFFTFFEISGESRDFSLKTALLYQWQREAQNLWLEVEGNLALGRKTSLFIGYRECIVGRPIAPFDDMSFRGFYAGISFRL